MAVLSWALAGVLVGLGLALLLLGALHAVLAFLLLLVGTALFLYSTVRFPLSSAWAAVVPFGVILGTAFALDFFANTCSREQLLRIAEEAPAGTTELTCTTRPLFYLLLSALLILMALAAAGWGGLSSVIFRRSSPGE